MAKGESKSYDPASVEKRIFQKWMDGGYFRAEPDNRPPEKRFCLVIPPPNVTGALHLGHALNNTLQDILIRQKRMDGFNTFWLVGTDHAGIGTQAVVEKTIREKEGKSRHDLGRDELVRRIWEWKEKFGGRIVEQLKLMGCSCDYSRERFTLDEGCAKAVRETFFKMFRDGLIYRGKRLVNWDTQLQTAVADDEVYHETVKGHFYHFKYPIIDPKPGEPEFVQIATTRPETMLADTAVAVHPEPDKALDKAEKEARAKLAEAGEKDKTAIQAEIDNIGERRQSVLPNLMKLRDMAMAGRKIRLPLTDRIIPLICDEWADPSLGTGCVKITPAHDPNDYEVGKRHELPKINVLTPDGKIARIMEADGQANPNSEKYEGLRFNTKGREKVVEDLQALGLVEKIEDRMIDLGHSDRSKSPIEPFLSEQWFVKMSDLAPEHAAKIEGLRNRAPGLAQMAIKAVKSGDVQFKPARYEKTYADWLGEKRDWCISRQLWWGHRIPVWYIHTITGGPTPAPSVGDACELLTDRGIKFHCPAYSQRVEGALSDFICIQDEVPDDVVKRLEGLGVKQDPDVLDTWFSSALWPHSTLGWPEQEKHENFLDYFYPTNVLSTAREIITLWVARMVITGLYNTGRKPFTDVVIHPVIQDGEGRKMSKSLGNGVDPVDIIDEFGADALRFTLAELATETQDIRLPVKPKKLADGRTINVSEKFEKGRNFCNKLWQASTGFVLANLDGYAPRPLDAANLKLEDRWILSRLTACQQTLNQALGQYRFSEMVDCLYHFMWDEYCSWYIEMTKSRLMGSGDRGQESEVSSQKTEVRGQGAGDSNRQEAQQVLIHVLDQLLRMLHPIVPFISEALWEHLNAAAPKRGLSKIIEGEPALVAAEWPKPDISLRNETVEHEMGMLQGIIKTLREMRTTVNDQRAKAKQPSLRSLPSANIRAESSTCQLIENHREFVRLLSSCDALEVGTTIVKPTGALSRIIGGLEIHVPVSDLIDLADMRKQEEAKLEELRNALTRSEKQLSNESFVQRADPQVVQQARMRNAELSSQIQRIQEHLADLV